MFNVYNKDTWTMPMAASGPEKGMFIKFSAKKLACFKSLKGLKPKKTGECMLFFQKCIF